MMAVFVSVTTASLFLLIPARAAAPMSARVTVCARALCLNGRTWPLYMASVYGGLADPASLVALARTIGVNTLRVTDFLDTGGDARTAPYDEKRWRRVDAVLAAAAAANLHIVLDLATYRNLLLKSGRNPYRTDWTRFLTYVAHRQNTITGVVYGQDPTIAFVSFAGEVAPPNGSDPHRPTSADLLSFYRSVLYRWGVLAPGQLRTAGGLLQLNWDSGVPWRQIFALPGNDLAAIHVYGGGDLRVTVPEVADWSRATGTPWLIEEFGFDAKIGDRERAAGFRSVITSARAAAVAGVGFWNLGTQTSHTYDVGPQFPVVFAAVHDMSP